MHSNGASCASARSPSDRRLTGEIRFLLILLTAALQAATDTLFVSAITGLATPNAVGPSLRIGSS